MSNADYDRAIAAGLITNTQLNSVFQNLKDATDGTSGLVARNNTRNEALNENHLAENAVHDSPTFTNVGSLVAGTTRTSQVNGAAEPWITIYTHLGIGNPSLENGQVWRWFINQLVTFGVKQGSGSGYKMGEVIYLKVVATVNDGGGDFTLNLTAPFGWSLTERAGLDGATAGSSGNFQLAYTRLALSGIHINRTPGRVYKGLKVKMRFNENFEPTLPNSIATGNCSAFTVAARM